MRDPVTVRPSDLDAIPDRAAVFLLWAGEGKPYLARTALLRRRLRRLISERERISRVLNLRGVVERIEYWVTGSQLDASLVHLELAQRHYPEDWPRMTRLRPPAFVRLTLDNQFPRTLITSKLGRGLFYGPFSSRAAAEHFEAGLLDLFQVRRCEENLIPSPGHPGCIYGEMNRCLRPCQQGVSVEEYRGEVARVEQFLHSGGASLIDSAETAREKASAEMQFEDAERLHQRVMRIMEVRERIGPLACPIDRLGGVAVVPSAESDAVDLWFMLAGCWQDPRSLVLSETAGAGQSLDHRLRDMIGSVRPRGVPNLEHMSILIRWHGSSWRDGEWLGFESLEKVPYRKLVNAIGRQMNRVGR